MVVRSAFLTAAAAAWTDGAVAGGWIPELLAPFGPSVGHAVPRGFASYAVVPVVPVEDGEPFETLRSLQPVLDHLAPFTGADQDVYTGMSTIWDCWFETGTTPRPSAGVIWDGPRPSPQELARARAEASAEIAADMIEFPDVAPLDLPNRRYYVWKGPLQSATAFDSWVHFPPSLVWPHDRSWYIGIPEYSAEIAVGASPDAIAAITSDPNLNARDVSPDYELDIDD